MLPVIVCDDDSFTLHTISELVKRSIESCGQNARIACLTASGRELLGFIQKNPGTYLYFLDFDLGRQELNGIDLVRQIYPVSYTHLKGRSTEGDRRYKGRFHPLEGCSSLYLWII